MSRIRNNASQQYLVPYLLAFIVFCNNILWASFLPFNKAPDESDHYTISKFVGDYGRLPVLGTDLQIYWMNRATKSPVTRGEIEYFSRMPQKYLSGVFYEIRIFPWILDSCLTYLLTGLVIKVISIFSGILHVLVFGARVLSALCGALTVFFTYKIAQRLLPEDDYLAPLAAIFVGSLPQFTFVSSYINQEAVAALIATLIFFSWVRCAESWSGKNALLLGVMLGLGVLSKPSVFFIALLTVLFVLSFLREGWRKNIRMIAVIALSALAVCGWFFIGNYRVYGSFWPTHWMQTYGNLYYREAMMEAPPFIRNHSVVFGLLPKGPVPVEFAMKGFLDLNFRSFWGMFGWLDVPMPESFYLIAKGIVLAGAGGLIKIFPKVYTDKSHQNKILNLLLVSFPVLLMVSAVFSSVVAFTPQGRYLFPAIAPFAIGITMGWLALFKNARRKREILIGLVTLLVTMNIWAFLTSILFRYYL
ncbi:MAG TPA: DUF2142 domain-containing protein [Candidatus Omnitrophota bacterium]|nr:DUF2142 domain-containing protein [Candidatus Omnitrophota bacterium]HPD83882.1 DUF2142 domain-containing protein [Candidatus Omnitrophota bacterium]HRZ02739.1 DUF2142 domain-containing protein [Candidatus Omnitrophota bacterium]